MPDSIHLIPLAEIDANALARDRTAQDEEALFELRLSIAVNGLRMPIEVFELAEPEGELRYGLISGFRRLAAFRELSETAYEKEKYAAIPAFLREPQSIAEALVAMVEENAIRAEVSPWEQAMVAVTARDRRVFDTVEAAVDALYANLSREKRKRLRALAHLTEELAGYLTDPETLSLRQLLRLASAMTRGYGDLMRHALGESSVTDPGSQWQTLLPILVEAETGEPVEPAPRLGRGSLGGRPRRMLKPRAGLTIRREMSRDGWILRFTGREATGMLIDSVLDEIERMFSPA
jgi:ParB family chromosome partitioning protein